MYLPFLQDSVLQSLISTFSPRQSRPLNAGLGFEQDLCLVWFPVPQTLVHARRCRGTGTISYYRRAGSKLAPPADLLASITWLPHGAVLQSIWIVEEDRREHLFDVLLHFNYPWWRLVCKSCKPCILPHCW